jgi:hypothetical protein
VELRVNALPTANRDVGVTEEQGPCGQRSGSGCRPFLSHPASQIANQSVAPDGLFHSSAGLRSSARGHDCACAEQKRLRPLTSQRGALCKRPHERVKHVRSVTPTIRGLGNVIACRQANELFASRVGKDGFKVPVREGRVRACSIL